MTDQEKQQALEQAIKSYNSRIAYDEKYQPKGFSKWGNDKCISRTADSIEAMENGTASERQIKYWQKH